jgi:hypothetical protein
MTHTEDLIFKLRDTASRGVSSWGDLQQEAADELEALINAVNAEREACAKVCEHEWSNAAERDFAEQCAAIIRGREVRGQA